jgi:hypothetical protein
MIALLPELDEAYRLDPQWCGGSGHVRLIEARYPLMRFLGIIGE